MRSLFRRNTTKNQTKRNIQFLSYSPCVLSWNLPPPPIFTNFIIIDRCKVHCCHNARSGTIALIIESYISLVSRLFMSPWTSMLRCYMFEPLHVNLCTANFAGHWIPKKTPQHLIKAPYKVHQVTVLVRTQYIKILI